ncbi:MAG: YfjI family protein, partial [Pseudonocardiaceae bacterium]
VLARADGWEQPTPLAPCRQPATFPMGALPEWCREYATALAEETQTPPDLAGVCVLGVLSACAGGRALVEARAGWREPVNLYLLPVLPPGARKSAVISAATRPLLDVEHQLVKRSKAEIAETLTMKEIATRAADRARRDAANTPPDQRDSKTADAISAADEAEKITVPTLPRLLADDVTPEAVVSLLADQGGRIAVISAEGGIFEVMAGRYTRGLPTLDPFLKGHAGDPIRVDRKGRPPEYVQRAAMTMLLTVQPAVLEAIARNGAFRGRGLLARYLYSIPNNNIGRRRIGAPAVPADVTECYQREVRGLAERMADWTDPAVLVLDQRAHAVLLDTEEMIEPQLAEDGRLGPIADWGGKLAGAIARMAGLLHLAAGGDDAYRQPINGATMTAAVRLGSYFAEHARAAFRLLAEDTEHADARYVLAHLCRRDTRPEFSVRELHRELPRHRFASTETTGAAVAVLADHNWAKRLDDPPRDGPGRPPSPRYRLHPHASALSAQSAEPSRGSHTADTADCADTDTDAP